MSNLSLCSGFGGLDLAVEQVTGVKTMVYAENNTYAARVMEARFPWAHNIGDITTADWAAIAAQWQIKTITAGFPCQDISSAGRKEGIAGARSGLWRNVAEAVRIVRPRLVFLENVAAIRSRGLGTVLADLAEVGYDAWWTCLRAGDPEVGNPTTRDRWFCIAAPVADSDGSPGGFHVPGSRPGPVQGAEVAERSAQQPGRLSGSAGGEVAMAWGAFEPAIRRWEHITGRASPYPTEPGARGGRRPAPRFVEWLMGCEDGWVTNLDLPLNEQLRILGNGVVTRQAVVAYRSLLGCEDVPVAA